MNAVGRQPATKPLHSLLQLIAAEAAHGERIGRLTDAALDALVDAGLFRMLLPAWLGGGEMTPKFFLDVVEAIGAADASTGWCIVQTSVCSTAANWLGEAAARHILGDRRAILAWGFGTDGRATPVAGGWRISGAWGFGSGGRHATWLGGSCALPDGAGSRMMLFPQEQAEFTDAWDVMGLRATGSDRYAVADLFVPTECSFRFTAHGTYGLPPDSLWAGGFASVAIGVAQAMLDALVGLAADKTPRGMTRTLAASGSVQGLVAMSDARLRAARLLLRQAFADAVAPVELAERMAIRLAASHAIREARLVVEELYHAAGTTAVFASQPFERRVRDMHMISQHVHGRAAHFETVGQFMLGLSPDLAFL